MEIALSSICGPDDIITPIRKEDEKYREADPQNYFVPFSQYRLKHYKKMLRKRERLQYFNHISAYQVKSWIGEDIWNSYYKFCFERNPWDKVISHYYYRLRKYDYNSLTDYFKDRGLPKLSSFHQYCMDGYSIAVDRIFAYENLNESLPEISEEIGVEVSLPSYRAKGNYRKRDKKYTDMMTPDEKFLIEVVFGREINLMGYEFGKPYTGDGFRNNENLP